MRNRIFADPAFVYRFGGELVAGVAGDADVIAVVIEAAMHQKDREDQHIAHLVVGGQPAATDAGAQRNRVAREPAARGDVAAIATP